MKTAKHILFYLALLSVFASCSVRKNIPQNEYLLNKIKVKGAPAQFSDKLETLVRPQPNNRFLFMRLPMRIYFATDNNKEKGTTAWIRKNFGEAPVLFDSTRIQQSTTRLESYMFNKGYFNADVDFEVNFRQRKRKANVTYNVTPKDYYTVSRIDYYIQDRRVDSIVTADSTNRLIKTGRRYDSETLTNERDRITLMLKNLGYYQFLREYVYFEVDTSLQNRQVNVAIGITLRENYRPHKIFYLNRIFVEPDYSVLQEITDTVNRGENKDTLATKGYYFVAEDFTVKPFIIADFIFLEQGELYRLRNERKTLTRLADLRLYKFADIKYDEIDADRLDSNFLNAYVRLTPTDKYEFVFDLEARTTEENKRISSQESQRLYGFATRFSLINKNLYRRAIQNETTIRYSLEYDPRNIQQDKFVGNMEAGASNSLNFPRIFFPGLGSKIYGTASNTSITLSYLFEKNREFERSTGSIGLGYQVLNDRQQDRIRHLVTLFGLSLVNAQLEPDFEDILKRFQDPLIASLFEPHLIPFGSYSFLYNNSSNSYKRNFWNIRLSPEIAGNSFSLGRLIFDPNAVPAATGPNKYQAFNIDFYQYAKLLTDVRYNYFFSEKRSAVFRFAPGIGVPYGNSKALPYQKRFFIGGSRSLRGWRQGQLGPGSFKDTSSFRIDQTGELLLEGNVEYRFDMGKYFEGAVFTDVGNIWTLTPDPLRPGAKFDIHDFYHELAVAGGLGLRMDFSFFIFRIDFGWPLRDPANLPGDRWQFNRFEKLRWITRNGQLNFGIGYPF